MKYIFIAFIISLLWFGVRPAIIRKHCLNTSVKVVGRSLDVSKLSYSICLVDWGMKPEAFYLLAK